MPNIWKKIGLITGSIISSCVIIALPIVFFLKPSDNLVIGNFQSYLSSDVQKQLTSKYNPIFQYYSTNTEIPTYIKNKTLDVAVATNNMIAQLAIEQQIKPIPWSKFNIQTPDGKLIENYNDLKNIVTPATWTICESIGQEIGINNLLEYCVPYFMQKFVFAYRGQKITTLANDASFNEIFTYISQNENFTNKNGSVMMIQDARSIYDIASLINSSSINIGINPKDGILKRNFLDLDRTPQISTINEIYNNISNFYKDKNQSNILTFNSDSSIVLNKLALHQTNGAFMYNGDAIYSAYGGDNDSQTSNLPNISNVDPDFHTIIPQNNFYALDGFVINKNISEQKENDAIEVIKDICLSGMNDNENLSDMIGGRYKYLSMQNFNNIMYTPCYNKLYNYVMDYYFQNDFNDENSVNLLKSLLEINSDYISIQNIELPLNNLMESNLNAAFEIFKYNL